MTFNTLEAPNKQPPQNACENCRRHRRKCSSLVGTNCKRCRHLGLVCFIKDTRSTRRRGMARDGQKYYRNRDVLGEADYMDEVCQLEEQVMAMERELQAVHHRRQREEANDISALYHHPDFGQSINTTMNCASDMVQFLEKAQLWIKNPQIPSLNLSRGWFRHDSASPGWFSATFKCIPFTQTIIDMLITPALRETGAKNKLLPQLCSAHTQPLSFDDPPDIELLKYDAIGCYFSCVSCLIPVLAPSYFLDILLSDTNAMLSNAVAACVVNGRCNHLNMEGLAYTRAELGGILLERAYRQLQDALFDDDEPTLEIAATLHLLSTSYMARFDLNNVKLMSDLAWRMISQLKRSYFDIYDKDKSDPAVMIRAEAWRRLFYSIRAFELEKCELQINTASLESIVWASRDVGWPEILPDEANDPASRESIEVYQYFVSLKTWSRIHAITFDEQVLRTKLCCSSVEKIMVSSLESLQRHIMEFWYKIPEKHRFTDTPIGGRLNMDRIRQCTDPKVLYLNIFYYRCWLNLEMRFMSPPETADMTSTSLARTDRERCILIVSYASDALATLILALHQLKPCVTETHHIAIVADVLLMLTKSTNKEIRERAQTGLQTLMFVLSDSMGTFDRTRMQKPAQWSHSLYVINLKQVVETYFESYVCNPQSDLFTANTQSQI